MTKVKRAIKDYNMIDNGDKIAVGISGGKDSSALLYIMKMLQQKSPYKFELHAIHLGLGLPVDISPLEQFCEKMEVPLTVVPTEIAKIIFDIRQETNPCSLCAKMRRGILHNTAKELGCNKVALGHHLDDAIETFLMNLIYTGKMGTFMPKLYLDRIDLTLLRPLVYLPEQTVVALGQREQVPVISNPCPANGYTKREETKQLVNSLEKQYPDIREKFLSGFQNLDMNNIWRQRQ